MKVYQTISELSGSAQNQTGLFVFCRENLGFYIVQAPGYVAGDDDITVSNGRVLKFETLVSQSAVQASPYDVFELVNSEVFYPAGFVLRLNDGGVWRNTGSRAFANQPPEDRGDGTLVDGTGAVWEIIGGTATFDIQANVPSRFATMQAAIEHFYNKVYPADGFIIDLVIESGHQPSSGLVVNNGDYSNFRISSQDPEVTVAAGFGKASAFVDGDNANMPTLNCLVNGNSGELGIGYRCHNNSEGYITPGSGAKFCWQDGLAVRYGSRCYAEDTIWTNNAQNGTTSSGIVSWSAHTHANGADVSNSAYYGAQAAHGGILNFKGGKANNVFRYGIRASDGAMVDADGASANDSGLEGVRAFNGCVINFASGSATGAAQANVSASGSLFDGVSADLSGSLGQGVVAIGSTLRLNSANVSGAAGDGLEAFSSVVSAAFIDASNCQVGIKADGCSNVNANTADASGCSLNGISSLNGSTINAEDAVLDDCGQYGANAWYGSRINMNGATARRAGARGVYAFSGSSINAKNVDSRKVDGSDTSGPNADITCLEGSNVSAHGAIGGTNKTINTLTSDGVIYK